MQFLCGAFWKPNVGSRQKNQPHAAQEFLLAPRRANLL